VFARDEQFIRHGADHYRRNEIWRRVVDRRTGDQVGEELLLRNCALVKYVPSGVPVLDSDSVAAS
jgi:vancomycin resistance protein VanW